MSSPPEPTFSDLYHPMSDTELQELLADWHSLIPEAQSALTAELSTRHLESAPPPAPSDDVPPQFRNLVTLRRYRDLSEAIVARAVLESAGIFCFLKDENLVRLDWQVSNFIGGIRLQVGSDDEAAAEAILSEPIPDTIEIPDQPGFTQPRCPRCNSNDIAWEPQGRSGPVALVFAFLYWLGLPFPRARESWHCRVCDLNWFDTDD